MPWVRIDENAMDHPKIAGLSDGAFRLWVQGLAYCQKHLTDGLIQAFAMKALTAFSSKRRDMLVHVGLWHLIDSGCQVHDYLQWNDSREEVLKKRDLTKERVRRLRGRGNADRNVDRNALQNAGVTVGVRRLYSGGVVCSDRTESSLGEKGDAISVRAGRFVDSYQELHERYVGVPYMGNPVKDFDAACRLVEAFDDATLPKLATIWLNADDDFATNGTRTITKFLSRASDYAKKLKAVLSQ